MTRRLQIGRTVKKPAHQLNIDLSSAQETEDDALNAHPIQLARLRAKRLSFGLVTNSIPAVVTKHNSQWQRDGCANLTNKFKRRCQAAHLKMTNDFKPMRSSALSLKGILD
jgi:hypothetical protein